MPGVCARVSIENIECTENTVGMPGRPVNRQVSERMKRVTPGAGFIKFRTQISDSDF